MHVKYPSGLGALYVYDWVLCTECIWSGCGALSVSDLILLQLVIFDHYMNMISYLSTYLICYQCIRPDTDVVLMQLRITVLSLSVANHFTIYIRLYLAKNISELV